MKIILITGCAGFIGFHVCKKLLSNNFVVIGVDSLNDYYDIKLKKNRLKILKDNFNNKIFKFYKINITNKLNISKIFSKYKIDYVINLAAQAGVRDSLSNPYRYLDFNIIGFLNIIELSAKYKIKHLVYASTSSVYGLNNNYPYSVNDNTNHQIQFYAVTKKTNELMAHTWSYLYGLPTTGLRFFTVYGPWGRPDMALYKFADNICKNKAITVFNRGNHIRDFTYIDDIVNGVYLSLINIPKSLNKNQNLSNYNSYGPHRILNLGCGKEVKLMQFIKLIEKHLGIKAKIKYLPMQQGDIHRTSADIKLTKTEIGYNPKININEGIEKFIKWYKKYHKI